VSSAGGSFSHTSFHVGPDFTARCSTYPDQVPILSLDAASSSVSITPDGMEATDAAVKLARDLLRAVRQFAGEIERMHAARLGESGSAEGGTSATGMAAACGAPVAGSTAA
jgi:hypothetical protein